jgi:hypothetical protein
MKPGGWRTSIFSKALRCIFRRGYVGSVTARRISPFFSRISCARMGEPAMRNVAEEEEKAADGNQGENGLGSSFCWAGISNDHVTFRLLIFAGRGRQVPV